MYRGVDWEVKCSDLVGVGGYVLLAIIITYVTLTVGTQLTEVNFHAELVTVVVGLVVICIKIIRKKVSETLN